MADTFKSHEGHAMTIKPGSEGTRSGKHQHITTDDQIKDKRVGHEAIRVDDEGEPHAATDHASPSLDDVDQKKKTSGKS